MLEKKYYNDASLHKTISYGIILLFLGWLVLNIFISERIPVNAGQGYDGATYAILAQRFLDIVFNKAQFSPYLVQRIFPSGVVYFFLNLFHISPSTASTSMPSIFAVYNTVVLVVGVFVWHRIAKKLNWSMQIRVLSFAGLFLNFAILKMNTYDPILTDTTAFVLGLLLLYFYIIKKPIGILLTGLVGAFTFPTLLYVAAILFIFPSAEMATKNIDDRASRKLGLFLTFLTAASLTTFIGVLYLLLGEVDSMALGRYSAHLAWCLSIFTVFIYFLLALYPVYNRDQQVFLRLLKSAFSLRLVVAMAFVLGVRMIHHSLANDEIPVPLTNWLFIETIAVRSLAYPGIFLVNAVMYFGPIICLLIYFWRDVIHYFKKQQPALFVLAVFYLILSINSESRQLINFLPIAVFGVAEILNRKSLNWTFTYSFVLLSVMVSKVWLPLNHGVWPSLETNLPQITLEFPMQWYFMNHGPWMSHLMYVINLAIVAATFSSIYFFGKFNLISLHREKNLAASRWND